MALPWDIISENVLNISKVLNDVMDTVNAKDVEWIQKDDTGNIYTVNIPNLAKIAGLFGKMYIGAKSAPPTTRLDGTPVQIGDMYFDTTKNLLMIYNGTEWNAAAYSTAFIKVEFTGDGTTTDFTVTGGYNPNFGMVYLNGSNVGDTVDISDGNAIKFNTAPANGDNITAYFFNSFEIADTYTKTNIDILTNNNYVDITDSNNNSTLEIGKYYFADTSNSNFLVYLPATPSIGDIIYILDIKGTFRDNTLVINGNGKNVEDGAQAILNLNYKEYKIIYTSNDWRVV